MSGIFPSLNPCSKTPFQFRHCCASQLFGHACQPSLLITTNRQENNPKLNGSVFVQDGDRTYSDLGLLSRVCDFWQEVFCAIRNRPAKLNYCTRTPELFHPIVVLL